MKITIIIPEGRYVNRLAACLSGLVENSYYKHDILVITSDIELEDISEGVLEKRYNSVSHYMEKNKKFMKDNNIYFYNITLSKDIVSNFAKKYMLDKVETHRWEGGTDTAFKDNFGIDLAKTDWIMPNFDDDFYPSKNWDLNLFKCIDDSKKQVYIPTHIQPYAFGWLQRNYPKVYRPKEQIDSDWVWNKSREIACARPIMPVDREPVFIYESEWNSFVEKFSTDKIITEPCAERRKLHYLPMLYKKEDIKSIGGFTLIGSGYEINVDDRFAHAGYSKVSVCNSFIIHKGFVRRDKNV